MTGSVTSVKGFPGFGVYAASKAALCSFAHTWLNELKGRNMLVTESYFNATQVHQARSGPAELRSYPLPVRTEAIKVSQMWHPRLDADAAHRWLRGLVLATCREPGR